MMNIVINGEPHHYPQKISLATLIAQMQPETPFAVALNTQFIAKSDYDKTMLCDQDQIEIVRPVAGG